MAFGGGTVWEVRTTGSDSNGGGYLAGSSSVDYSQQNTPQLSVTDAVTNGSSTLTSASAAFNSTHVGNVVYLTGGTATLSATRRQITSVSNATTIILDSAVASGTGITLNLGGALASPGVAAGALNSGGNTVWIKAGVYLVTATANVAGGFPQPSQYSMWLGYNSARGDATLWGTLPTLRAAASSMVVFQPGVNEVLVANLELDGNASGGYTGVVGLAPNFGFRYTASNCRAKNCTPTGSNAAFGSTGVAMLIACEAMNTSGVGFRINGSATACYSHDNTGVGFIAAGNPCQFTDCIAAGNGGDGFVYSGGPLRAANCTAVDNGGNGYNVDFVTTSLVNCLAFNNSGYGFVTSSANTGLMVSLTNCAGGANTAGNVVSGNIPSGNMPGFVTLTADPFVNRSARNLALNTTAGGGVALRGGGLGTLGGGLTANFKDIGAAQHKDAGSSSGGGVSKARLIGGV